MLSQDVIQSIHRSLFNFQHEQSLWLTKEFERVSSELYERNSIDSGTAIMPFVNLYEIAFENMAQETFKLLVEYIETFGMEYTKGLEAQMQEILAKRLPEDQKSAIGSIKHYLPNLRNEKSLEQMLSKARGLVNSKYRSKITLYSKALESKRASQKNQTTSQVIKVLFLAANPSDGTRLRLDQEVREIDQALRQSEYRDNFKLEQQWAVRLRDIQGHLLRFQPTIVHFSGHGSSEGELIFEDNSGNGQAVSQKAISNLFSSLKDNIRCVVLNACYSKDQAEAIATHIDCVVGMSKAIGDEAAINFASSFYQGLGYGRTVQTAFDLGSNQIDLESFGEEDTPKLIAPHADPSKINLIGKESNASPIT